MKTELKTYIQLASAVSLVVLMVLTAELLCEPEIIFPEVAALTAGGLLSEKMPWQTTHARMLLMMSVGAFAGYFLSGTALPLLMKLLAGFVLCAVLLHISGTTMLPVISACLLPILLGSHSLIYPMTVIIFTALVILLRILFKRRGWMSEENFSAAREKSVTRIGHWGFLLIVLLLVAALSLWLSWPFMIAPPVIVAFAELSYDDSPARKFPGTVLLLMTACGLIGCICRLLFCVLLSLPMTLAAAVAAAAALLLLQGTGKLFPPAGALALLPFLIPENTLHLFPFEILIGAGIFVFSAMLYGKLREHITQKGGASV